MNQLPLESASQFEITTPTPAWFPQDLKDLINQRGEVRHTLSFTRAERKVFKKRKHIKISKWAEKHRYVTMSSLPGPWRNETTQYLVGIMDASFFPSVSTIIICAAPQVGKSELVNNCIGYAIDRAPGPVLFVYPDELTARENSKDRIQPMIQTSPRLRSYMTGVQDDMGILRLNLQHMPIYMGWASSPARLANKPIRYVVFDETDKYPETAGKKESDPISLGEKRTNTYKWNRKIWKISTPTIENGYIWVALTTEAQVIFFYWVRCPKCWQYQIMHFENIKWPEGERNPEKVQQENLAWYVCEHCQARWDDSLRNKAVQLGHWRSGDIKMLEGCKTGKLEGQELFNYLKIHRPAKIGFHLPGWLSYFISLSECASSFLKAL